MAGASALAASVLLGLGADDPALTAAMRSWRSCADCCIRPRNEKVVRPTHARRRARVVMTPDRACGVPFISG